MTAKHIAFSIGDETFDLAHLDAFTFGCPTDFRAADIRIGVRYSNHCYTVGCGEDEEPGERLILDHHNNQRSFCDERYALSHELPGLIAALPTAKVWQSHEERNYLHFSTKVGPAEYRIFFHLRKASAGADHDLALFVESAYPLAAASPTSRGRGQIRFAVLARKILLGEKIRFDQGRNLRK